jgi:hypothetical protein
MTKSFFTKGADPVPLGAELVNPIARHRNAVRLEQQKAGVLAKTFAAQQSHFDKRAGCQHIAARWPTLVKVSSFSGNASIEVFTGQFLEFSRQPVRTIFPVNQEKLCSFASLRFTPADELGEFGGRIHVKGRTL